jgi:hypothetical protein
MNPKQSILIFEYRRPNYLRVCLDSIVNCEGVEDWSILLSIDGPEYFPKFQPLFGRVSNVIPWDSHAGNLWHVTRSLEKAFSSGYERVLFMDGDCILRRDALKDIPSANGDYLFTGFAKGDHGEGPMPWFSPQANLLEAKAGKLLLEWVRQKQWVGRRRPGHMSTLQIDYPGYDAVFCRYMLDHGLQTRYRAKSYAGHIGVVGLDCHAPEIEAEIFTGHPSRWLRQAVKAFDPKRHHAFTPADFAYED